MRVMDAIHLKNGDLLLCKRIALTNYDPPTIVKFERTLVKHKKDPARLWVIHDRHYYAVNVRDCELTDPLQRIANELLRKE
jgi:hypothetical protein